MNVHSRERVGSGALVRRAYSLKDPSDGDAVRETGISPEDNRASLPPLQPEAMLIVDDLDSALGQVIKQDCGSYPHLIPNRHGYQRIEEELEALSRTISRIIAVERALPEHIRDLADGQPPPAL